MKEFPQWFQYRNQKLFEEKHKARCLSYLRRDVFEHILRRTDENDSFDIQRFDSERVGNMELSQDLAIQVATELENLGWGCSLAYGKTVLYIHQQGQLPIACGEEIG